MGKEIKSTNVGNCDKRVKCSSTVFYDGPVWMCFGFCVQQFHWHSIGSCNRQHCHKLPLNILANLYQDETRRPTGHLPVTSCGHSVVASRVVTACVRKGFRGGKRAFHWLSQVHVGGILLLVANECICRLLCGSVGFAMRQCADRICSATVCGSVRIAGVPRLLTFLSPWCLLFPERPKC